MAIGVVISVHELVHLWVGERSHGLSCVLEGRSSDDVMLGSEEISG